MFKSVLVTGGAGYVGSLLTPQLLDLGYTVTVYDIMYFGDHFLPKKNPNLKVVSGDIRDIGKLSEALKGIEVVINLACISNDASFELDEKLSTSIEEHPLVPLTLYNKYKGLCEPRLFKHQSPGFVCVTIRPATLCGFAPRQRMDLSVNILTNHAINNRKITVFGGSQKRPNLHIQDMVDLYRLLLNVPDERIAGQIFNAGFQNMSIMEIAQIVKRVVQEAFPEKGEIPIVTTPTDDIRSYHVNSDKIQRALGFKPTHTVEDAVRDLCTAFKAGKLPNSMDDTFYFNVRRLKSLKAA